MDSLTFKEFLCIVEDLGGDIAKIQGDVAMLDTEVAKRTQPLAQQKQRLLKMLFIKQKQKEQEDKTAAKPGQQQSGQAGSQMTAPGSTGAATPGQGVQAH